MIPLFQPLLYSFLLIAALGKFSFQEKRNQLPAKFVIPLKTSLSTKRLNVVHGDGGNAISVKATSPTLIPTFAPSLVPPPPNCITNESDVVYVHHMISATQTLGKCIANIPDPYNIPTFYNGAFNDIMKLYTNIQVNNLQELDAVGGMVTLDFNLRLYWKDNRLNMPIFWNKMSTDVQFVGVEVTKLIDPNLAKMPFWLPDIRFHDAASITSIIESIRINASNDVVWSQHILITIMQPNLEFSRFPQDSQTIHLRYGSYAYSQTLMKLIFLDPGLSFSENFDTSYSFLSNPLWKYNPMETSYQNYLSSSGFMNCIYHITVSRQSLGVIIRLVFPILLFLYISGLTFWEEHKKRAATTSTLLFAISALYVVIIGNIPMLGYITFVDAYVSGMYIMLCIVIVVHTTYARMCDKIDRLPLRYIYTRMIEFMGRVFMYPICTTFYVLFIEELYAGFNTHLLIVNGIFFFYIILGEVIGVSISVHHALHGLLDKFNDFDLPLEDVTLIEIFVFNCWRFRKLSVSTKYIAELMMKDGFVSAPEGYADSEEEEEVDGGDSSEPSIIDFMLHWFKKRVKKAYRPPEKGFIYRSISEKASPNNVSQKHHKPRDSIDNSVSGNDNGTTVYSRTVEEEEKEKERNQEDTDELNLRLDMRFITPSMSSNDVNESRKSTILYQKNPQFSSSKNSNRESVSEIPNNTEPTTRVNRNLSQGHWILKSLFRSTQLPANSTDSSPRTPLTTTQPSISLSKDDTDAENEILRQTNNRHMSKSSSEDSFPHSVASGTQPLTSGYLTLPLMPNVSDDDEIEESINNNDLDDLGQFPTPNFKVTSHAFVNDDEVYDDEDEHQMNHHLPRIATIASMHDEHK